MNGSQRRIISGHSHITALVGPRHEAAPTFREIDGAHGITVLDGQWPRGQHYWETLIAHARGSRIAIIWGGNEHNLAYFFRDAYDFDFASRQVSKILNNIQLIARSTIRKRFYDLSLAEMATLLDQLKSAGPERLVIIGTPPPKKDNERLRAMFAAEPHFLQYATSRGFDPMQIPITEPHIRLKLWYLLQDLFAAEASRIGAEFLPVAPETQDAEGYLKPEFWQNDVTHANSDYGAIMLERTRQELERK